MAVTLYHQVGKGKPGAIKRSISVVGAAPPISRVPYFLRIRWLTARSRGNTLAMTSMRRSPPRSASKHISMPLMQMSRSFRTKTEPV